MDILLAILTGLAFAVATWKPFFGNMDGFREAIHYYFKPDLFSWLDGEYIKDWRASVKFISWILLSGIIGKIAHIALQ